MSDVARALVVFAAAVVTAVCTFGSIPFFASILLAVFVGFASWRITERWAKKPGVDRSNP